MLSQLKRIARALWSNPPTHGARIAAEVVGDPAMFEQWKGEMAGEWRVIHSGGLHTPGIRLGYLCALSHLCNQ